MAESMSPASVFRSAKVRKFWRASVRKPCSPRIWPMRRKKTSRSGRFRRTFLQTAMALFGSSASMYSSMARS